MIERTKSKITIYQEDTNGRTTIRINKSESRTNIWFRVSGNWRKEEFNASFTLYEKEILVLEELISEWKSERMEKKAKKVAKTKAKPTLPEPPA